MTCSACGHDNPERAKFCIECGTPMKVSGAGSQVSGPDTRHLTPDTRSGARKVVTIIFGDLVGSTALHERLDAEAVRQFMERYYAAMRGAVEAHGGRVTQVMGDGVKAIFGAPRVSEDDALRAVRAAVAMQRAFAELAAQQRERVGKTGLRVAVNTGEVVADDDHEIIGDPVNVAARLQEQSKDGDVVIGATTQRLVAAFVTLDRLGSFALKGRSEQVEAFRVVSLEPPAGLTKAAFFGRDSELARLTTVYRATIAQPAARLAVVLGSPGLGKSRLIEEITQRVRDTATVLTAHCDAAGGATFAPVAEALRTWLSARGADRTDQTDRSDPSGRQAALAAAVPAGDPDRDRIVSGISALLAGSPASPEETFFVVRRCIAALAAHKPVMLVIDDLHWAEPLLLDLVEHLVQWGSGVPLFVLVGARPELRNLRTSLTATGGFVSDLVTLSGLDAGAAMRLAASVLGAADLPTAVAAKVLATSEGNPLFVGELVRMLVQEGALTKDGDRWTAGANLAALEMPPTIHALLAARIERLHPAERGVLERAAVIGRHFSRAAVAALLSRNGGELDAHLQALRRSELIEPDTGWFLGEPLLRFHHVLIRDAAYRRLLKGTRAEMHERLADWIETQIQDSAEHDETIGWHLEQAHQLLGELGPLDDHGRTLGNRAALRLAAAGRRALARDDVPLAGSLLGRAIDRLAAEDPGRAELALDWCEALLSAGDVVAAAKAIDELGRLIGLKDQRDAKDSRDAAREAVENTSTQHRRPSTRLQAWHTCFSGQLTALTEPQQLQATVHVVAAAADELARLGDAAGEAKAHSVHAQALARLGKVGASEAALDKALAAARKAGDRRRANAVLAGAPLAALWGPSPVTRASGRCLDVVRVLRITQGAPAVEAVALSCQAVLEALRGRTDAARRMIASSRKMVEELGIAHRLFEADAFAGRIDLLEGDATAAERSLRGAYEGLRDLGLGIDAARAAALLARALLAQGKPTEAELLSRESEALAGDDLQAAIAWRGVRAEALAKRGAHTEAVELAQAAVAIAAATDALLDHADARLALAAALRAAGRGADADAENGRATELWEAKGATLLAERVRGQRAQNIPVLGATGSETEAHNRRSSVRANTVTALMANFARAAAARDMQSMRAVFDDAVECVDHPNGMNYGADGMTLGVMRLMQSPAPIYRPTPLATLGDWCAVFHRQMFASGSSSGRFDVGAYQIDDFMFCDARADGRIHHVEIFAADRLTDAVVRLYRRHAELLPEGKDRVRAEATARSLARMLAVVTDHNPDLLAAALAAGVESIDHRQLGLPAGHGADELIRDVRPLFELAADVRIRIVDVLRLESDALLQSLSFSGTDRSSGGAFELPVLLMWVFDDEGLLARWEVFDAEREDQAVARFAELREGKPPVEPSSAGSGSAGASPSRGGLRRIHPNSASVVLARMETAFAARDLDAVTALLAESMENIDHPTESTYGREGQLESSRRMMRTPDLEFRIEVMATLGDTLCLMRRLVTASGTAGGAFDVGAYEMEHVGICELDESGRCRSFEVFAPRGLGDAIASLYTRYAQLLPDGVERRRAAATAGAIAAMVAPPDLDRYAAALAPSVEFKDHRTVGFSSGRGATKLLRGFRSLLELASDVATRVDEIICLEPGAMLLRWTTSGIDHRSGGAFESPFLLLWVFGPEGLIVHDETFDAERRDEALARFSELAP